MFCNACGANSRDNAQFCRNCGTALQTAEPPLSVTEAPTAPLPPPPTATYESPLHAQQSEAQYTAYLSPHIQAQQNPAYPNYQPPLPQSAGTRATVSLILSVLSVITCFTPLGIVGMILGKLELNAIHAGKASPAGTGQAKAGFWIGLIATLLSCIGGLLTFIFWVLGISLSLLSGA